MIVDQYLSNEGYTSPQHADAADGIATGLLFCTFNRPPTQNFPLILCAYSKCPNGPITFCIPNENPPAKLMTFLPARQSATISGYAPAVTTAAQAAAKRSKHLFMVKTVSG